MISEDRAVRGIFYSGLVLTGIGIAGRLFCSIRPMGFGLSHLQGAALTRAKLLFDMTALAGMGAVGIALVANRYFSHVAQPLASPSLTETLESATGTTSTESKETHSASDPAEPEREVAAGPSNLYQPPSNMSGDHPLVLLYRLVPGCRDRADILDLRVGGGADRLTVLATLLRLDEKGFRAFVEDKGPNVWDNSVLDIMRALRRVDLDGSQLGALHLQEPVVESDIAEVTSSSAGELTTFERLRRLDNWKGMARHLSFGWEPTLGYEPSTQDSSFTYPSPVRLAYDLVEPHGNERAKAFATEAELAELLQLDADQFHQLVAKEDINIFVPKLMTLWGQLKALHNSLWKCVDRTGEGTAKAADQGLRMQFQPGVKYIWMNLPRDADKTLWSPAELAWFLWVDETELVSMMTLCGASPETEGKFTVEQVSTVMTSQIHNKRVSGLRQRSFDHPRWG